MQKTTSETQSDSRANLERISPMDLLNGFNRSPVLLCVFIAIGFHILLIGVTSLGYINDTWVDPEGAAKRREAMEQAKKLRLDAAQQSEEARKAAGRSDNASQQDNNKEGQPDDKEKKKDESTEREEEKATDEKTPIEKKIDEKATAKELEAQRLLGPGEFE